jgi:hypothetical protein
MARGKLSYMGSVNHEHAFAHHQEPLSALSGSGFESDRNVLAIPNVPNLKRQSNRSCCLRHCFDLQGRNGVGEVREYKNARNAGYEFP